MITYNINHVDGLFFEILSDGGKNKEYTVVFSDDKGEVYKTILKPNTWARLDRKYLSNITIFVYNHNGTLIKTINILDELKNKKVLISIDSKSLGDTLAWIPYCLEFKKKYNCRVVVSTFHNYFFEDVYQELQFVGRGKVVNELFGMFTIGWHWDSKKEPVHPATIPLQAAACNTLLLPFEEILPKIKFKPQNRPITGKYVAISTRSTSQLKEWYYWQDVIDFLVEEGYEVVEMSLEETSFNNITPIPDKSMDNTMNVIFHADFFIGLSSGLSWLSWALEKDVIMISNFSEANHEFQKKCIRITDTNICHGCWNNPLFKFNKGDWNYCPEHEDTPRQFECHKLIKSDDVISKIKSLISK